ncbi:unnamed protein product [Caenorhabditis angaria]|uniref:Uncharacterized protein n=1 Tax=Caenorhabditis angaria TaxID=860376 RepID=A0A9P1IVD9_9PELO|nr:unnamed protein product [Caenorhabditis angaria]
MEIGWFVVIGLFAFCCCFIDLFEFCMLKYRRYKATWEMEEFEKMMTHIAGGHFFGVPLSPNEQVLRAVCYCNKAMFAHHRLRRVDPLMPIRYSTGGSCETPIVFADLNS